ncbi:hypothetical protein [uncultured Microbacterium sp.]|uniref:hypothetical protein n=1 Tax=uncultured Microbacterium sp. TaxID=191216 RepID=UPI0026209707|nr:hypothetical protein [uncultured Microbacterium sp.]
MGIFQSRPEEPTEWGGLPSEPWEPREAAEILPPPVDDLGILGAAGVAISVPVEVYLDRAQAEEEPKLNG